MLFAGRSCSCLGSAAAKPPSAGRMVVFFQTASFEAQSNAKEKTDTSERAIGPASEEACWAWHAACPCGYEWSWLSRRICFGRAQGRCDDAANAASLGEVSTEVSAHGLVTKINIIALQTNPAYNPNVREQHMKGFCAFVLILLASVGLADQSGARGSAGP